MTDNEIIKMVRDDPMMIELLEYAIKNKDKDSHWLDIKMKYGKIVDGFQQNRIFKFKKK